MRSRPAGPEVLARPAEERERLAEVVADRMDGPVTALGILFVLLVVADPAVPDGSRLQPWLDGATWVLWMVFVAEYLVRLALAPARLRFLRRTWWQILFLLVPFLRFLRVLGRSARLGRVVSSSVRGARSAAASLSSRVVWLGVVTLIVIFASGQLLHEWGGYESYPAALHDAAHSAISAEPLEGEGLVADSLELVLAVYAVVIFAVLAGSFGAFFLDRRTEDEAAARADGAVSASAPATVSLAGQEGGAQGA